MPNIEELLEAGSREIVRGHLRKIVEIYDLEWIVVHELIQNAIDAVQANSRVDRGEVTVLIDFDRDTVTVRDNGIGFAHDLGLLRPGGTGDEKRLSSRSPAKGYQGVGLKAVMYSTERFQLSSKTLTGTWNFSSTGLSGYISEETGIIPEYIDDWNPVNGGEDTYTEICATFPQNTLLDFVKRLDRFLTEDAVKWKDLYREELQKGESDVFEAYIQHFVGWYFRTQSYIGCVNSLLNISICNPENGEFESLKPTEITIVFRSTSQFEMLSCKLGEWLRKTQKEDVEVALPYKAWDFAEIIDLNNSRSRKYRISPDVVNIKPNNENWERLSVSFRDKFLDLKLTPNEQSNDFRERYADIISILERPRSRVNADDFRDVLEKITGIYLAIGRTSHFEMLGLSNRGLRLIASNGTPTSHEITVRSTSSTWYLETIHFVVNVDSTLNIGKRHMVNNTLVGRVRDFFEACYPKLVSISKLFVERDTQGGGEGTPMPDVLFNKGIRRKGIPFKRFPTDENTLIGLFSVAISILDPEFSAFGFFSNARYDGKFLWKDSQPNNDLELKVLEFKQKLEVLTDEFDNATHDKEFRQVALIIVWDRRVNKPGWTVKGISEPRRTRLENQNVPTDLVEYVLEDIQGDFAPLICVADLLERIPLEEEQEDDISEYVRSLG